MLNPYTAKYAFYWLLCLCVIYDIFELWRHRSQWDGPLLNYPIIYARRRTEKYFRQYNILWLIWCEAFERLLNTSLSFCFYLRCWISVLLLHGFLQTKPFKSEGLGNKPAYKIWNFHVEYINSFRHTMKWFSRIKPAFLSQMICMNQWKRITNMRIFIDDGAFSLTPLKVLLGLFTHLRLVP